VDGQTGGNQCLARPTSTRVRFDASDLVGPESTLDECKNEVRVEAAHDPRRAPFAALPKKMQPPAKRSECTIAGPIPRVTHSTLSRWLGERHHVESVVGLLMSPLDISVWRALAENP